MLIFKLVAIALIAAVLAAPASPLPFSARVVLLAALLVGGLIWLSADGGNDEDASGERPDRRKDRDSD